MKGRRVDRDDLGVIVHLVDQESRPEASGDGQYGAAAPEDPGSDRFGEEAFFRRFSFPDFLGFRSFRRLAAYGLRLIRFLGGFVLDFVFRFDFFLHKARILARKKEKALYLARISLPFSEKVASPFRRVASRVEKKKALKTFENYFLPNPYPIFGPHADG
ncbi:MAG: hypothetical protein J5736_00385 [Bacilli bacterium]|nr:hypothetical protein [Bacilli bacterium]